MQRLSRKGSHNKIPPEMKSVALFLALTALCASASAQFVLGPAVFSPAAPTDQDNIVATIRFVSGGCSFEPATIVSGSVITETITIYTCLGGSGSVPVSVLFGPLPAGSYTFKVYWRFVGQSGPPTLALEQPLTVTSTAPAIPALSPTSLFAVAFVLMTLGFAALTRTPR